MELKPCPFCGADAEMKPYTSKGIEIRCMKCHIGRRQKVLRLSIEWLEVKMVEDWNKRVQG